MAQANLTLSLTFFANYTKFLIRNPAKIVGFLLFFDNLIN